MTDQAVADGLDDGPERVTPEVVDVDTSAPKPDVDEQPEPGDVVHLPVRREVVDDTRLGTLIPLQEEMRGVAQLAVTLATSKLVPKALQDKPADVLAIILTGRELGVAPMTAVRMFHVIGGTVTLAPKVRMAMVRSQGLGKVYPHQPPVDVFAPDGVLTGRRLCPCGNPSADGCEGDPDVATWHAERHDTPGIVFTSTYTTAMAGAVTFDEWTGDGNNRRKITKTLLDKDNWKNYPAQMCQWRALGYLLDQAFSEVGTGLYSPDEVGAVTDEDGEPILDVTSTEVLVPADNSPAAQSRARAEATRAKQGPKDDPPASPDTISTFKARIDKIKGYEGAATALLALWGGQRPSGDPGDPLPKVDELLHRQCKQASALIDMIEKRISKGEFGPSESTPLADPAPPSEATDDAPRTPESAPEAQPAPDVPPEASGATQGELLDVPVEVTWDPAELPEALTSKADLVWVAAAPAGLVGPCADAVKVMTAADVYAALEVEGLPTTGNAANQQQRLTMRRIRQAMQALSAETSDG